MRVAIVIPDMDDCARVHSARCSGLGCDSFQNGNLQAEVDWEVVMG
jgi:hypothetical protein